jgi:hypothetical protein
MSALQDLLYAELAIKSKVNIEGINVKPSIFKNLELGTKYQEQIHGLFEMDHVDHVGISFPCSFSSPNGLNYSFNWDPKSDISIEYYDNEFYLLDHGKELFPVKFFERPYYYGLLTSDGTRMSHVGSFNPTGQWVLHTVMNVPLRIKAWIACSVMRMQLRILMRMRKISSGKIQSRLEKQWQLHTIMITVSM